MTETRADFKFDFAHGWIALVTNDWPSPCEKLFLVGFSRIGFENRVEWQARFAKTSLIETQGVVAESTSAPKLNRRKRS